MFRVKSLFTFLLIIFCTVCFAQSKKRDSDVIKSAYVFLFAEQIEWGKLPTSKFRIVCIGLSSDRLTMLNKHSELKKINGREIEIRSIDKVSSLPSAEMILLGEDRVVDYQTIYKQIAGKKTVIVSEELLSNSNMMINVYRKKNNTYAFEINKANILSHKLGVKLELILFGGGSDGDVLTEYNKIESELSLALDSLEEERQVLIESRKQINELSQNIQEEKDKLELQKLISKDQNETIIRQINEIKIKEKEIAKFSRHLDEVKEDIDAREFQLRIKNGELKRFGLEVSSKQDKLKEVNEEVRKQLEKVEEQKKQIKIQQQTIQEDIGVIEKQRFLLVLQIGVIILVGIVLLLLFLSIRRNKKNNKQLANQNMAIQKQTVELNARNKELIISRENINKAFEELNGAQSQLVQAEKLASLGMLVAGVAHDINTPLGAINASAQNMHIVVNKLFLGFSDLIRSFTERELLVFKGMVRHWETNNSFDYSSVEKRRKRRRFKEELEKRNVPNASTISLLLIEVGIDEIESHHLLLLDREDNLEIFENLKVVIDLRSIGNTVKQAVDKASDVVFALKKYSREDDQVLEEIDIKDSLETVLSIYRRNLTDVNLVLSFQEYNGVVFGKYSALCQVWTNLIHNAVQAMKGEGELELGIEQIGDKLHVFVKDGGEGIKDEDKDKIFNPFFTTKKRGEGTGLGLDICRKIIEKHDGEITFLSKTGIGTTFSVYLPIKTY